MKIIVLFTALVLCLMQLTWAQESTDLCEDLIVDAITSGKQLFVLSNRFSIYADILGLIREECTDFAG